MTAIETKDKGINEDLAGKPGEFYSMGDSHAQEERITPTDTQPVHTATVQERRKEEKNKKEEKSKDHSLLYWRIAIGMMIILIVVGLAYFITRGINWGIKKVASTGQPAAVSTTVLRSNADPLSSNPTGPVISNKNMIPVTTPTENSSSTESARVAGVSTQAVNRNNNCPDYATEYYYCEWIDQYTYRPYRTEQEYRESRNIPRSYSTRSYSYAPAPVYTPAPVYSAPTTYYPQYPARTTGVVGPNGCPDYEQGNYSYCRWIDQYTYQGYR